MKTCLLFHPRCLRSLLALVVCRLCAGSLLVASPTGPEGNTPVREPLWAALEEEERQKSGEEPEATEDADRVETNISLWDTNGDPFSLGRAGGVRTMIIRTTPGEESAQAELEEDLAVMGRVLDKAVSGQINDYKVRAMGIELLTLNGVGGPRAIYLENTGALFFLRVPFPLLPPAEETQTDTAPASRGDSAWEEARRELYGGGARAGVGDLVHKALRLEVGGQSIQPYSKAKVDQLRSALVAALKNGARVRQLGANEELIVCVAGPAPGSGEPGDGKSRRVETRAAGAKGRNVVLVGVSPDHARRTMMTLRVKKADLDALAADKLTVGEFEQKVSSLTYTSVSGSFFGLGVQPPF
jgi:hypothetical protein